MSLAVDGSLVPLLLDWYSRCARTLPWRSDPTSYHVWISEIMLQQTRVEAVKAYYLRFLEALPDVRALAAAPEDRLLKLWEGLGYYSRARNLQKAARVIVERYGGVFPSQYEAVRALPGVGDYTAGAILSIAFGQPEPAVDGNVLRVISRVAEHRGDIASPQVRREVTRALRAVYPARRCGDFTQSLMELGALVCLPNGAPLCGCCPLAELCLARRHGTQGELPVKTAAKPRRVEERTVFLLCREGRVAVRRRPARGLLAGLWELPNVAGALTPEEASAQLAEWGLAGAALRPAGRARHVFTHIEWQMTGFYADCAAPSEAFEWVTRGELAQTVSLPAAFRPFLDFLP